MNAATMTAEVTKMTAGVDGKWSLTISTDFGVSLDDLTDQNNLPAVITPSSRQTSGSAFKKARKVWDKIEACGTFRDVWQVLQDAGCKTHYYCRMD